MKDRKNFINLYDVSFIFAILGCFCVASLGVVATAITSIIIGIVCVFIHDKKLYFYAILFALGGLSCYIAKPKDKPTYYEEVGLSGIVSKISKTQHGNIFTLSKIEENDVEKDYKIKVFSRNQIQEGSRVGLFSKIMPNKNTYPVNPNKLAQEQSGLSGIAFPKKIETISESHSLLIKIQNNIINFVLNSKASQDTKGIILGLTIGKTSYMPKHSVEAIRDSGCAHILAISGLHITIIAYFFYRIINKSLIIFFIKKAQYLDFSKISFLLSFFVVSFYVWISGSAISSVRSIIMFFVILVAIISNKQHDSIRSLSFTAGLFALLFPSSVFTISFQLSFLATFCVMISYNSKYFKKDSLFFKIFNNITTTVKTTIIVSIFLAPLEAYYFNRIQLLSVVGNATITPITEFIILPLSFLYVIFRQEFMLTIINKASEVIFIIAQDISNFKYSFIKIPQINGIVIFGILILMFLSVVDKKRQKFYIIATIMSIFTTYITYKPPKCIMTCDAKNVVCMVNRKYKVIKIKNKNIIKIWERKLATDINDEGDVDFFIDAKKDKTCDVKIIND